MSFYKSADSFCLLNYTGYMAVRVNENEILWQRVGRGSEVGVTSGSLPRRPSSLVRSLPIANVNNMLQTSRDREVVAAMQGYY